MIAPAHYARDDEYADLDYLRMECEDELMRDASEEEVSAWAAEHGWEPVTECNLCHGPLAEDRALPICMRCEDTCRAHARQERARREYEEECRHDPLLERD